MEITVYFRLKIKEYEKITAYFWIICNYQIKSWFPAKTFAFLMPYYFDISKEAKNLHEKLDKVNPLFVFARNEAISFAESN